MNEAIMTTPTTSLLRRGVPATNLPSFGQTRSIYVSGLATIALLIVLAALTSVHFANSVLWVPVLVVWVIVSSWFYKIELDAESKRCIVDKL
jgi:hypothetical protein